MRPMRNYQRAVHRDVTMRAALSYLLRIRRKFADDAQLVDVWEAIDKAHERYKRRKSAKRNPIVEQ